MLQTAEASQDRADEFRELLLPVLDAAYGWALHATRNRADAEDLVQDAVSNALRAFASFRTGTNFKAWFFRILMNCFYSSYRKQKSEKTTLSIDDAPALYIFEKSGAAVAPLSQDPARAAMADDMAVNLKPAADMGMRTVWIRTEESVKRAADTDLDHVHHQTEDFSAWLQDWLAERNLKP